MTSIYLNYSMMLKRRFLLAGVCALSVCLLPILAQAGLPGVVRGSATVLRPSGLKAGVVGQSAMPLPRVLGPVRVAGATNAVTVARGRESVGLVLNAIEEEGKLKATATTERPHLVLQVRNEEGWSPVASRHLTGEGSAEVVFEMPEWTKGKTHRVMAYEDAGFPKGFTGGERSFASRDGWYDVYPICGLPVMRVMPVQNVTFTNDMVFTGGNMVMTESTPAVSLEAPVEADIWKIVGTRLYFFNQYRGLQVFDLSNPAAPVKTGAMRMSAVGEQLYVLNDRGTLLALVTDVPGVNGMGATEIVMVEVTRNGVPKELSRFRMNGRHEDSRWMGSELHLVLTQSDQVALVSVDFSKPKALVIRSNQKVPGWTPKLQAVAGHLLVATTGSANYGWVSGGEASTVHVYRALRAGGTELAKSVPLKGVVLDKFKMNLAGNALVAVTQTRDASNWMLQTWVETYALAGAEVAPMARVSIPAADWETLYATRFDGTKVYVVTFRQIDPLFVVELDDPANPVVTGELKVPGWSTYLLPRGDQLLAVGIEEGRATVSIFGVADPAVPTLVSRVFLGGQGNWSSTEANYDEKAVEYLPEAGLLLLPFQKSGYASDTGRYWVEKGIQVVRVGKSDLTLGELIPHEFEARRGTLIRGHFVSISGRELVVVKRGAGKGQPVAQVSLAWQVDEVVPFGDYLLQIERGSPNAMLRVTTVWNPDGLVEEIDPGPGVIVGVERRGEELFVAQKVSRMEAVEGGRSQEVYGLRTWRFDLAKAPMVREMGRVESWGFGNGAVLGGRDGGARARAVWARGDLLVWEVTQRGWYGGYPVIFGPVNTIGVLPALTINVQPVIATFAKAAVLWTNDLVLNVIEAEAVKLLKPRARERLLGMLWPVEVGRSGMRSMELVALKGGESDQLKGEVMAQDGLVFLGMEVREAPWVADAMGVGAVPIVVEKPVEATEGVPLAGRMAMGYWSYVPPKVWSAMMVVDFTQKTAVVREPVGVPGGLVAVANVGSAGGIVVAVDAINREVKTLVYDGVACWSYADTGLAGRAGLMAGDGGLVCRALGGDSDVVMLQEVLEPNLQMVARTSPPILPPPTINLAFLEAYRYAAEGRGFVQGDVWSFAGKAAQSLRIRSGQVFLKFLYEGVVENQLAGLGAGARLENRRTVKIPSEDYTLNLEAAVMDLRGAGLWVPRGMYGVGYFGAESVVMPPPTVEPAVRVLSAPVVGLPRVEVMGTRTIGPIR
jgi:hypothetical protein